VVARVERGERPRPAQPRPARWRGRRLVLAVALALLVPTAAAFAFPEARDDVLRWLGVKGAEVRREPRLPPAKQPTLADLGDLVTLEEAERRAGFRPLVPASLGDPGDVRHDAATNFVTFVYDGPLLVAQVDGALDRQLVMKLIDPRTGVREVDVDGDEGLFIEGPEHVYLYVRPDGSVAQAQPRLAGNTLLFSRGDRLFRIEAARLTLDRALAIARSLH
jgi:hypothetical protein